MGVIEIVLGAVGSGESYYMKLRKNNALLLIYGRIGKALIDMLKSRPRQKNTWVVFGTGKAPSA